jgi:hypothetical protein
MGKMPEATRAGRSQRRRRKSTFKASGAQDFIQLDLTNLLNAGFKNFTFTMDPSTGSDGWSVSACAVSGTDCFSAPTTGSDENSHTLSFTATNHFVDFSATGGPYLFKLAVQGHAPQTKSV